MVELSRRDGPPGRDESDLVCAAREGSPEAREELFRRYVAYGYGLVYRLFPSTVDVDDVVQTAFVNALTHLSTLQDPSRFKPWLRTVLIRCATRQEKLARRRGNRATFDSERVERAVATDGSPEDRARLNELYCLLERLEPSERNALILRRIDRESWEEIAESLDISVATAKRRVDKALKRLSKLTGGRDVV